MNADTVGSGTTKHNLADVETNNPAQMNKHIRKLHGKTSIYYHKNEDLDATNTDAHRRPNEHFCSHLCVCVLSDCRQ